MFSAITCLGMPPRIIIDTREPRPMLSIAFTFYPTLDLEHLERSIYSLSRQTALDRVGELVFVDNNTDFTEDQIRDVVEPYFQEPFVDYHFLKHGDSTRQECWSANYAIEHCENERYVYTHGDLILTEDAIEKMDDACVGNALVTGWIYLLNHPMAEQTMDDPPSYDDFDWRENTRNLLAYPVSKEFKDAVLAPTLYICTRSAWDAAGRYDEAMVHWGVQQSVFLRHLQRQGTRIVEIPESLCFHMEHPADRDAKRAMAEYLSSRGG